jgi:serine/threonine protein kinase
MEQVACGADAVVVPSPGDVVNGYVLDRQICETRHSYILKASKVNGDGAVLCIKFVKPQRDFAEHVENEIKLLKEVDCPHVIKAIDLFEWGQYKCVVMPYVQGGCLQRTKYPEDVVKKVIRSTLRALDYLHSNGIWHRDIKLDNLLISDQESPAPSIFLADLGLATKVQNEEQKSSDFVGTLSFAAPEIVQNGAYDSSIDIWSLGVTTYMLLSGSCPFPTAPECCLRRCIEKGAFVYPQRAWNGVSKDARDFIDHMLCVDPKQRMRVREALGHPWLTEQTE